MSCEPPVARSLHAVGTVTAELRSRSRPMAALLLLATAAVAAPPNLVFFLTDDQDQLLGGSFPISPFNKGATPLPNVQKLMVEEGATATNFFIHTPICALPAIRLRSSLQL